MATLWDAWSEDELAANRRGELAPSQIARLRRRSRILLAIVLPTFIGLSCFMFSDSVVGAAAVAIAITALMLWQHGKGQRAFRNQTRVVPLTGVVAIAVATDAEGGSTTTYRIDGHVVKPKLPGLHGLRGQTVTVYKLPDSPIVIAAERPATMLSSGRDA